MFTLCSLVIFLKKELLEFKSKCHKLVSSSYDDSRIYIDRLEGQIEQKDQVVNHQLASLKNLSSKYQSTVPPTTNTEVLGKDIFPALQSKIKKTGVQYSKEILPDKLAKENNNANASNPIAPADKNRESTKNQLELLRKDQRKRYQGQRSLTYDIEENTSGNTQSDQSNIEANHRWPSGPLGDPIVSGIDETRLSKKK